MKSVSSFSSIEAKGHSEVDVIDYLKYEVNQV